MDTLLLTTPELQALSGSKRATAIIKWLEKYDWIFEVAKNGHPKVSRTFFDARMGGNTHQIQRSTPRVDFFFK